MKDWGFLLRPTWQKYLKVKYLPACSVQHVTVPTLYVGQPDNFYGKRHAFDFTPGLANVQFVGATLYFPKQYAPGSATGNDCFENLVKSQLPLATSVFIDDWNGYHRWEGEVHCGTATVRPPFGFNWWINLP